MGVRWQKMGRPPRGALCVACDEILYGAKLAHGALRCGAGWLCARCVGQSEYWPLIARVAMEHGWWIYLAHVRAKKGAAEAARLAAKRRAP